MEIVGKFTGGVTKKIWGHRIELKHPFKVTLCVHYAMKVVWDDDFPDEYIAKDFVVDYTGFYVSNPETGLGVISYPKKSLRQAIDEAKDVLRQVGKKRYYELIEKNLG